MELCLIGFLFTLRTAVMTGDLKATGKYAIYNALLFVVAIIIVFIIWPLILGIAVEHKVHLMR